MERINVINGLKNKYIIPCFQREYSWGEEEIDELIKSLLNINNEEYCIGIVTIQDKKDTKILIDGQQRITTLYLIAIYCGIITKSKDVMLHFEYEELASGSNDLIKLVLNKDDIPQNIKDACRIIEKKIGNDNRKLVSEILKKVYYYEVNIDDNTDLNHYFEVMNSRGVQLSRSDIIKSYLMKLLENEDDRYKLNNIWNKYEKMDRKSNFIDFESVSKKMKNDYKSINEMLKNSNKISASLANESKDEDDSENSILNFEYFLLYIIRLYKDVDNNDYSISGEFNLDDLIKEYEDTFNSKNTNVIDFLNFMIKMKNNYDKYIVKYDNNSESWSLGIKNSNMLLIQSCLRVSFVNRRLMHWIYITLKYFYKNNNISNYVSLMRNYIRDRYINVFLSESKELNYRTGFDTPIIVLNYLDLLIKENYSYVKSVFPLATGLQTNEFKYKFRNSIEHFKPRHDKNGNENPKWVDDFGNLALLSYGTNTKMQNAEPDEKAKHFDKELSGYSLKLQIMSKIASSDKWDENKSNEICRVMISLLENDLANSISTQSTE